jgi:hypothetical protein
MTTPLLATHVRRARIRSVCSMCDLLIDIGQRIGKLDGHGWAHASCIVAANRRSQA